MASFRVLIYSLITMIVEPHFRAALTTSSDECLRFSKSN